ncbi:hypothetical protein D3C84_494620 [compost metagenome]
MPAFLGNSEVRRRNIAFAGKQRRQQFIPSDGNQHHSYFQSLVLELFILDQLLVQILLEYAKKVVRRTALDTSIDEIKSLAVNRQDSDDLSIDHPVEIASPRFHCAIGREGQLLTLR